MRSKYPTSILRSRIENFTSDNKSYEGFTLPSLLVQGTAPVEVTISVLEPHTILKFEQAQKLKYTSIEKGGFIGKAWATSWAQLKFKVPSNWQKPDHDIYLHIDTGCESMVYDTSGNALQCTSENRQYVKLDEYISSSNLDFHFYVEFACNRLFGNGKHGDISPSDDTKTYTISTIELVLINTHIYELQQDFKFLKMLFNDLPDGEIKNKAFNTAHDMITMFLAEDPSTWPSTRKLMSNILTGPDQLGYKHEIIAMGHCHIDTAWLWGYSQTIQKCARSWLSQINFMRNDPKYKFVCSQTIQMEWVKRDYPTIWKDILHFVKLGQFIPVGGSVVECDGNIPSGEAFCRQMLYGQLFFESEFGFRSKIFWLPDTFGYSAQLPQILKHAQMPYFLTQKLSWNNINTFPHHSFIWQGIDQSEVIAHFPPASTYCSDVSVNHLLASIKDNKDLRYTNKSILLYGDGDGGQGPTRSHLANLKRAQLSPALPSISTTSPLDVFSHLTSNESNLSKWQGELYFELHRGTLTSQAKNKKYNRELEYKLQLVEQLYTVAHVNKLVKYPRDQFVSLWKLVLTNQFHDVLPGSSIELVYIESRKIYQQVELELNKMQNDVNKLLCFGAGTTMYNPHTWAVDDVIGMSGLVGTHQQSVGGLQLSLHGNKQITSNVLIDVPVDIISPNFSLTINPHGQITLYNDLIVNKCIINTPSNVFKLYEDIPIFWDAWDIEITALEKYKDPLSYELRLLEHNLDLIQFQLNVTLTNKSTLTQLISITNDKPITFTTKCDWNESHKLLKVHFTPTIVNDNCLYDIQYGHVQRPTHRNTSWDIAKFEVMGHKYMALQEYKYTAALLTNNKYGYSCLFNEMGISLLRSPKSPDANCDMGIHEFNYGFVGYGSTDLAILNRLAMVFNHPLTALEGTWKRDLKGLVRLEGDENIILDTVKIGEKSDKYVVLRLYEACGGQGRVALHIEFEYKEIWVSNGLEDLVEKGTLALDFGVFEVKTIVVELK